MPADNFILRHWQAELHVFHQNLLSLKAQISPEPVHDLRVAIKKLRSYLKLYVALLDKKEVEEMFVRTRELFSILGKHRNIEITKTLLLSFTKNDAAMQTPLLLYLQLLQDQIAPFCQAAIQQYDIGPLDVLTNQLQKDFENAGIDDLAGKIKEVVSSSIESIKEYMKHFKKKSHLVRKRLKDIFYWSKIAEGEILFTKQELKSLDKILDYLGNIQDHEVLITNLKNFRKTILPDDMDEYDLIKKIETKAQKKKDHFLERAHKMADETISAIHAKEKLS